MDTGDKLISYTTALACSQPHVHIPATPGGPREPREMNRPRASPFSTPTPGGRPNRTDGSCEAWCSRAGRPRPGVPTATGLPIRGGAVLRAPGLPVSQTREGEAQRQRRPWAPASPAGCPRQGRQRLTRTEPSVTSRSPAVISRTSYYSLKMNSLVVFYQWKEVY